MTRKYTLLSREPSVPNCDCTATVAYFPSLLAALEFRRPGPPLHGAFSDAVDIRLPSTELVCHFGAVQRSSLTRKSISRNIEDKIN